MQLRNRFDAVWALKIREFDQRYGSIRRTDSRGAGYGDRYRIVEQTRILLRSCANLDFMEAANASSPVFPALIELTITDAKP